MSGQPNGMLTPTILVRVMARDPVGGGMYHKTDRVEYRSYRELRKDIANQIARSEDGVIHVARSKRGQWGEWFEVWTMRDRKPKLVREGWQ